jgi:hypothetical protein
LKAFRIGGASVDEGYARAVIARAATPALIGQWGGTGTQGMIAYVVQMPGRN